MFLLFLCSRAVLCIFNDISITYKKKLLIILSVVVLSMRCHAIGLLLALQETTL
jgi:hypothetical protein